MRITRTDHWQALAGEPRPVSLGEAAYFKGPHNRPGAGYSRAMLQKLARSRCLRCTGSAPPRVGLNLKGTVTVRLRPDPAEPGPGYCA